MPAASIARRSSTSTVTPSSERACSASAVGVIALAGAFWRSRAELTASATSAASTAGVATSWCEETISVSTPAPSSAALLYAV